MADAGDNQRRSDEKESKSIEETKVNKKLNKNLLCSLQWMIMMKPESIQISKENEDLGSGINDIDLSERSGSESLPQQRRLKDVVEMHRRRHETESRFWQQERKLDENMFELLGEKTSAETKKPTKEEEKAAKVEEKKAVVEATPEPYKDELNSYSSDCLRKADVTKELIKEILATRPIASFRPVRSEYDYYIHYEMEDFDISGVEDWTVQAGAIRNQGTHSM
ncbi:unnamed protein product [Arabidopsis halleri]